MHLHHLDPLTKTSRGGSSPTSPPAWKHCPRVLQGLRRCLLRKAFAHLPPRKAWDHTIELHPNAKLPRGSMFPLSPAKHKELDEFLQNNLLNNYILPSNPLTTTPLSSLT